MVKFLDRILGREMYKRAIALFEKGSYYEAIQVFQEILRDSPAPNRLQYHLANYYCSQAHYYLGRIYFSLGNYGEGKREFERVIVMSPERNEVYEYLAACYYFSGDISKAEEAVGKRIGVLPSYFDDRISLASSFLRLELWEKADLTLSELIRAKPEYADIHYHLGLVSLGRGEPGKAVQHFEQAIALNPGYWRARIKLGMIHTFLGNFELALGQLRKTLEHFPNFPDLFYCQGVIHSSQGEAELAAESFRKAVDLNPFFSNARMKLAVTLWGLGKTEKARAAIQEGIARNPKDLTLTGFLKLFDRIAGTSGSVLSPSQGTEVRETDFFKRSMSDSRHSIVIAPNFSEMLSLAKQVVGQDQKLDSRIVKTVQRPYGAHTKFPDFHHGVGSILMKARKYRDAEKYFRNALELKPDYLDAHLLLIHSLKALEEPESALEAARPLLRKDISYPDFYSALGEVHLSLGREEKALEAFQKVLTMKPDDARAREVRERLEGNKGEES